MKPIRTFIALLTLGLSVFAQAPQTPLTDPIYRASKPFAFQSLYSISTLDLDSREIAARKLDAQGYVIDRMIDIYGEDAGIIMGYRKQLGFTWVPNAFQPNLVDPLHTGVVPPGAVATDMSKPWPRSIPVSADAKDYPPFTVVIPPAKDPLMTYYDANSGTYGAVLSTVQDSNGNWLYKEGDLINYQGKTLSFHLSYSIVGTFPQWRESLVSTYIITPFCIDGRCTVIPSKGTSNVVQ